MSAGSEVLCSIRACFPRGDVKMNTKEIKYKLVYSQRIRCILRDMGFEPIAELDNEYKPGFKCWRYVDTDDFEVAFSNILLGGRDHG